MGVCEDAPGEYCAHILEPEDAGLDEEANDRWHKNRRNAVCLREPKYSGLCVWHADTDEKTGEELVEARLTPEDVPWESDYVKEHLNGVILRGVEFPVRFSFDGCLLILSEFSGAFLPGAEFSTADLREAEFPDTVIVNAEFSATDLREAEFPDTNLLGAEFPDANLRETEFLRTGLREAEFPDADLREAEFLRIDLREAEFPDADLREAEFVNVHLWDAKLPRADLHKAEFRETDLPGSDLTEANLTETEFSGVNLQSVVFRPACARVFESEDTTTADPLGASLEDAQFEDGTDLRGADLSGARLYQTAFRDVRINDETMFGINEGRYGGKCRYEYDPNTGVSMNEDVPRLRAALWTYRRLELLFEDNAMNERARNAHIRKQETQRADYKKQADNGDIPLKERLNYLSRYGVSTLNWHLHRHGESLRQLLGVSTLLIFLCGFLYAGTGVARNNPETTYQITLVDLTNPEAVLIDLLNGWYFSVITFSTIGYGDFYPASPVSRVLVGIESLAGALLIALFVFVIGRRVAR